MRICGVSIQNFRNFKSLEVELGQNIILVGENKAGKSNFIEALRLVLDPSLSDNDRQLTEYDFWDGDGELPFNGREIKISVKFTDFADEAAPEYLPLSLLCDCFITTEPKRVAQITYVYFEDKKLSTDLSTKDSSSQERYKFDFYPGNSPDKPFNIKGMRTNIPFDFIKALRDIASDSKSWRRSPLSKLLKLTELPMEELQSYADTIKEISENVVEKVPLLKSLETEIQNRTEKMVGALYGLDPQLGLKATSPQALLEALRLFAEGSQRRPLERISLGFQNVLHLSLLSLLLEKQQIKRATQKEPIMPIVALEEPEAHLHPHLQRLIFKDFLDEAAKRKQPIVISTHSPQLVSAASLKDLVLLKSHGRDGCKATSAYDFVQTLEPRAQKDLERFLDITKSEMLFSKGVIFVEGDVEMLLVPEFAEILEKPLDKFGISVCNVYGTHFGHVVTLAHKFGIPYAVFTDGDKFQDVTGLQRAINLLQIISPSLKEDLQVLYDSDSKEQVRLALKQQGIFVNDWTLEPSLIEAGLSEELKQTFIELSLELGIKSWAGVSHINAYLANPTDENMKKIITTIDDTRWGKGRFAQRLISHIRNKAQSLATQSEKENLVPVYIKIGIEFLVSEVSSKS